MVNILNMYQQLYLSIAMVTNIQIKQNARWRCCWNDKDKDKRKQDTTRQDTPIPGDSYTTTSRKRRAQGKKKKNLVWLTLTAKMNCMTAGVAPRPHSVHETGAVFLLSCLRSEKSGVEP